MGIPIDAEFRSTKTDDLAYVVDPKKVNFREHPAISLTATTREMLGISYSVAPVSYWSFEGKSLKEIYDETYTDF